MGLLDKYLDDGSNYTTYNNAGQPNTVLATAQSNLHYYSVGRFELMQDVNNSYQQYDDGVPNPLPMPSQLDISNGYTPFQYQYNLPEGINLNNLG